MIEISRGIALHLTKHKDNSSIFTVYTRSHGRISCMLYGHGHKKSGTRGALTQALTLLEFQINFQSGKDIQQLKDIRISEPIQEIPFSPYKSSIALFLAELLFKILKQQESDPALFDFLESAILFLDHSQDNIGDFHLILMIKLTKFLGFAPNLDKAEGKYFDLMNGNLLFTRPLHEKFLDSRETELFIKLWNCQFDTEGGLQVRRSEKQNLLNLMIKYYSLHIPDFYGLKSLQVMQELFD